MTPALPFYHREQQLADLDRLTRKPHQAAFLLVYGRRRVGKTRLLRQWAEHSGRPVFYWMAPRSATPDQLRTELVREFWRWAAEAGTEVEQAPRYDNWLDVFRAMRRLVAQQPAVIILDEFPWAAEADPTLPSRLQNAWDTLFSDSRVCFIISGSHISALEKLLASDAPLFGRFTAKLYVPPFEFAEITPFVPHYSVEKRLAVYAILGGVPDYLRRWDDGADLMTNVREIFLSDLSPYRNETDVLISDVLRRDSPDYGAVLTAVAQGAPDLAKIADATVLPSDRTFQVLETLIDLRLVERRLRASVHPERQHLARLARYSVADPFLRFYYRLIEPHRSYIAQQIYEPVLANFTDRLRPFVAATFEELCRTWTRAQRGTGRLPFDPEIVGSDWQSQAFQADVVAVNWHTRQVLVGEAKWGDQRVEVDEYRKVRARAEKVVAHLQREERLLGRKSTAAWAVHLALFSRRGGTLPTVKEATADGALQLTFAELAQDLQAGLPPPIR